MGFDAARRSREPEWMDAPDVAPETLAARLADLERVNALTLGRRPVLSFVARAAKASSARRLAILDIGSGGGGTLRALAAWGRRAGVSLDLIGLDLSPHAVAAARAATDPADAIAYRAGDALAFAPDAPIDLVVSSLTAHHLADEDVVRLLRRMEAIARLGWCVADLERSRLAYHGFALLARAMRWHPFVRHDGPVSIARGFTRADWHALLARADLAGQARVVRRLPGRLVVERLKAAS